MLWLSGLVFLLMFFSLPETSAATILLQRARRVRKSLDKTNLKSQSEIDQAHMTAKERAFDALISKWMSFFKCRGSNNSPHRALGDQRT
jgi:DHA1 family multidrug resistance protein-like MFS transporter